MYLVSDLISVAVSSVREHHPPTILQVLQNIALPPGTLSPDWGGLHGCTSRRAPSHGMVRTRLCTSSPGGRILPPSNSHTFSNRHFILSPLVGCHG